VGGVMTGRAARAAPGRRPRPVQVPTRHTRLLRRCRIRLALPCRPARRPMPARCRACPLRMHPARPERISRPFRRQAAQR
jgi:hypothetical protein